MKRFGVIFILFITLLGLFRAPAAHAQSFNPIPSAEEMGKIIDEKTKAGQTSKEVYTINSQALLANGVTCMITGCSSNPQSSFYYGKSALAMMGNTIGSMYANPPANLALWIEDTGQSLGFIPPKAYAQGIGFTGFSALLPLWKVIRNIAYFLLAIIMIVIGFMVMFRKKIDPKTIVTVQNALPRIVLTLLLITFSYAIVGLMIDIMYLFIYLSVALFKSTGLLPDPTKGFIVNTIFGLKTQDQFYIQGNLLANMGQATSTLNIYRLFGSNINVATGNIIGGIIGLVVAGASAFAHFPPGVVAGGILGLGLPILQLILALALVFLFIRLLIFFINAYIQIVIAMLFGPIQILMEAIPGTNSFVSWIQHLITNLIVFPVGIIFFMLSGVFANFAQQNNAIWTPNLATLSFNGTAISSLISLGILFAIPTVGTAIKEALKAKPFISAGPEGIASSFGQPINLIMQGYQLIASHQMMNAIRKGKAGEQQSQG